jgi:hypothetical protein
MGYAELISLELQSLPDQYQAKVLSFVTSLKAQNNATILPTLTAEQIVRRDELLQVLAPFSAEMNGFVFDRDQANARR